MFGYLRRDRTNAKRGSEAGFPRIIVIRVDNTKRTAFVGQHNRGTQVAAPLRVVGQVHLVVTVAVAGQRGNHAQHEMITL